MTIVENELVPVRGYFQFSAVTYYVLEDSVVATITVNRIGGDAGLVRLDYTQWMEVPLPVPIICLLLVL